ncbi:UNVERIFIED_CONTAM: Molybdate transporter 2 [Sesamum angustifolium]|uniref:Molybdate transporter 2 n=1 Tax=Sesamum angustifolium TaxID=2727405 RepID=A0AAW2RK67_9LAMI
MSGDSPEPTTPLLRHHLDGWRNRLATSLRLKTTLLSELSGAVGDLGTYIPIVLALTLVSHLDLSTTLIFTALYNIATGVLFGTPMPVQPMKSIAAVAVSETPHLTVSQIAAAGISTAAVLLFLGVTGLMSILYRFLPLPVGLAFAFSAIKYIRYNQDFTKTTATKTTDPRPWLGLDGLVLALVCLLVLILATGDGSGNESDARLVLTTRRRRVQRRLRILSSVPSALIVFLLGLILCFIRDPTIFSDIKLGPSRFHVLKITWDDFKVGFVRGAVPQIPLSVLNSVIACRFDELGRLLVRGNASVPWGGRACRAVPFWGEEWSVCGVSWIGETSSWLAVWELVCADSEFIPSGHSWRAVAFAGIELAMASRDMNSKEESFVMLVCAAVSLTGSSAALGFGCGIVLYLVLKLREMDFSGFPFFRSKSEPTAEDESLINP